MLRVFGRHILLTLRGAPHPPREPAEPQAPGGKSAILRGVYDQNRALHTAPAASPSPRAQALRRARPWRRLAVPLVLVAALAGGHALRAQDGTNLFGLLAPNPETLLTASLAVPAPASSAVPAPSPRAETASPTPPMAEPPTNGALDTEDSSPLPTAAPAAAEPPLALADIAPLASEKENLKKLFGLSVRTIVIDAGHGGHDPGAIGKNGMQEKDVTLDVAQRLKAKLEQQGGYRVLLVRDDDHFVPLTERASFANSAETDLFVSIHVNYLPSTSTNAVETYFFGRHQDARTRKLAERENQGSEYSLSEFESVLRNVQDTIKHQESRALATSIQGSLLRSIRANHGRVLDNGVRTAPFVVLLGVKAPSVLVEIGSLSSPEAERSLGKENYRDEIASYVVAGINQYLNQRNSEEEGVHDKGKSRIARSE